MGRGATHDHGSVGFAPVLVWAALGAALMVLCAVVLVRWLADGGAYRVQPGPDPFGGGKLVALRFIEFGQMIVSAVICWLVLVRPLVRREPLGFDALLLISFITLNVWDPLDNHQVFAFQYNAHMVNVASWGEYLPFWQSPQGETWAVPLAFVFGGYVWAFYLAAKFGCHLIARLRAATPQRSLLVCFGVVFVFNAAVAGAAELVFLWVEAIWNFRTPPALTLWHGGQRAFPLYNPFAFSAAWTVITALRWSWVTNGHSFVEGGLERLQLGRRTTQVLRYLAVAAFIHVAYVSLYFVQYNVFAMQQESVIDRSEIPSYFVVPDDFP